MFKKGDTLVCVNNAMAESWLSRCKIYISIVDEEGGRVLIKDDNFNTTVAESSRFTLAEDTHAMKGATGDGRIELSPTLSIELSILETCVQLLDEIRKPSVPSYHREHLRMAQQVIDSNTANAEIVQSYLKRCFPKTTESLS